MVLVPAIMALLGAKAWWMPRWLERVVPQLHLEGSELAAAAGAAEPPGGTPAAVGPRRR
jgi:putative drug exporter of the RND superfamily